jgi:anaerobic C4-dicarboxylate transporter
MPTLPDESMSIERPAALLNKKTFEPGMIPVAVGGIAWMLPTTVKFENNLLVDIC